MISNASRDDGSCKSVSVEQQGRSNAQLQSCEIHCRSTVLLIGVCVQVRVVIEVMCISNDQFRHNSLETNIGGQRGYILTLGLIEFTEFGYVCHSEEVAGH